MTSIVFDYAEIRARMKGDHKSVPKTKSEILEDYAHEKGIKYVDLPFPKREDWWPPFKKLGE